MNKSYSIEIPSRLDKIKDVIVKILELLNCKGASHSDCFDIRLCVEEALVNAIKYGNKLKEKAPVSVTYSLSDGRFEVSIEDRGDGFDYHSLPDPTKKTNILRIRGRGVFLIRHVMDEVRFNKKGNRITMVKYLKS